MNKVVDKSKMQFSVVVPIYNEEGNITKLDTEIKEVMSKISKSYEIIYVNDGSKDGSLEELNKLKKVKIIDLNRNYGQATALDAGFKAANGKLIISMDGDGQNDPKDIPRLLKKMKDDNLDVVCGYRKNRADKKGIRILTRIGRLLRRTVISDTVHDTGCTLRVYTKAAAKSLDLQGEMHRYILALLRWKGFRIDEIVVNDRLRENGKSAYGYSKAVRGFIDLVNIWFIQKYSQRPSHMFGALGILSAFTGFGLTVWTIVRNILYSADVSDNGWFIVGLFMMGASVFLFSMGFILDMLIRIQLNTSNCERRYYIRSETLR